MNPWRTPRLLGGSATAPKAAGKPCDVAAVAQTVLGGQWQKGSEKIHKRTR